jgi:hypothetical protein
VGAPIGRRERRPRRRPRPEQVEAGNEPPSVEITRVTAIRAGEPFADEGAASAWLAELDGDPDRLDAFVAEGIVDVNAALHAARAAAQDAFVPDVAPSSALAVRAGYGAGDALADGEFTEAITVPPSIRRTRRSEALRPQERVARVLGGHEQVEPYETHLLRARADLDCGRQREAAVELEAGVRGLLAEAGSRQSGEDELKDLTTLEAQGPLEERLLVAERVVRRRRILG